MANDAEPEAARRGDLGALPSWDLEDLYPRPDPARLNGDR